MEATARVTVSMPAIRTRVNARDFIIFPCCIMNASQGFWVSEPDRVVGEDGLFRGGPWGDMKGGDDKAARTLELMVATVPSILHSAEESYYHSIMLMWMRLIGFEVCGEQPNNLGRSDIVWEQPNLAVVAEIKYAHGANIDALLKEAIAQIHEKRYYNRYTGKVLLLGIAFSEKNVGCRMEVLNKN
jgi:hypothetical protein